MTTGSKDMMILKGLVAEFEAVDEYFKAVREVLRDGHMPDLSGLDARIGMLCEAVQNATPDIQQRCLPKLDELLRKLDLCEEDVRTFQSNANKSVTQ